MANNKPQPRTPPVAAEAEKAVLGAAMLGDPQATGVVVDELRPEHFYRKAHRLIHLAIQTLHAANEPVDFQTVQGELLTKQTLQACGGVDYLVALSECVPTAANTRHYVKQVQNAWTLREIQRQASEMHGQAGDFPGDGADLADHFALELGRIAVANTDTETVSIGSAAREVMGRLEEVQRTGLPNTGHSTGLKALDSAVGGYSPGDLVIVAGRPSMGKTAFMLGSVLPAARGAGPVLFVSAEMTDTQLAQRALAHEGRVQVTSLRTGRLEASDWSRLGTAIVEVDKLQIRIADRAGPTVRHVRAIARHMKATCGLSLVCVDYLQLMTSENFSERHLVVGEASRGLKALGKELKVPVLAAAQLNRQVEQRPDKRPKLSDLKESGDIEQDADVVLMLYRDEYYNPDNTKDPGVAEIRVAKQRNGPTPTVKVRYDDAFTRFGDITGFQEELL